MQKQSTKNNLAKELVFTDHEELTLLTLAMNSVLLMDSGIRLQSIIIACCARSCLSGVLLSTEKTMYFPTFSVFFSR